VERSRDGGLPWGLTAGLALGRAALMLTWHGSLLYLVLVESTLLVTAALTGRRVLYAALASSSAVTLLVLAPVLAASPEPLGGLYSSIALSRLHLIAVSLVALVSGSLWLLEGTRPGRSPLARLLRLAACGLVFAALVLALPGPREGLVPAFRFLTLSDEAGARTGEQFPLLPFFGREVQRSVPHTWSLYVYWIPLLPIALLFALRGDRERRPVHWALAAWCAAFGLLALLQRRYGNDLAPAFSVAMAVVLARLSSWTLRRTGLGSPASAALAVALALLLFVPSIASYHLPRVRGSIAGLRADPRVEAAAARSAAASLTRFALAVRRATPETAGFFAPDETPEYGVIAHANLGHALHYLGRRATATDPLWAYIGPQNWERSFAFLDATREAEALALARALNGRYVVTTADAAPGSVVHQLHWRDGNADERGRRLEHFRLIDEGPRGGRGLTEIFRAPPAGAPPVPYKLFEIVEGAVIEARAASGSEARARLVLRSPAGRELVYAAAARADAEGRVRLRVPYASEGDAPVRAVAPWQVRIDGRWHRVPVSHEQVRGGERVPVRHGSVR
jgi:asparagine N-glycosylation enzyme membrane subunit Stt3